MPLPKQIDDHEHEDEGTPRQSNPLVAGFAGVRRAAFAFAADLFAPVVARQTDPAPAPDMPRVGEYFADYSDLSPEEIAKLDRDCEELFRRSKPVSR